MKNKRKIPHVPKEERSQLNEGVDHDKKDNWFKKNIINPIIYNVNWQSFSLIGAILIIISFFDTTTTTLEVLGVLAILMVLATILGGIEKKRHTRS